MHLSKRKKIEHLSLKQLQSRLDILSTVCDDEYDDEDDDEGDDMEVDYEEHYNEKYTIQ